MTKITYLLTALSFSAVSFGADFDMKDNTTCLSQPNIPLVELLPQTTKDEPEITFFMGIKVVSVWTKEQYIEFYRGRKMPNCVIKCLTDKGTILLKFPIGVDD